MRDERAFLSSVEEGVAASTVHGGAGNDPFWDTGKWPIFGALSPPMAHCRCLAFGGDPSAHRMLKQWPIRAFMNLPKREICAS